MVAGKFKLILGSTLLLALSFSTEIAFAATATGRLSCMDASTTSNLIYVEFSGAGTTGANLYRYGAAQAVATYPNRDSGQGSANDTGLSPGSMYHYELHSGSQVIASKDCTTKAAAQATPAPSQSSPPTSPPASPTPSPSSQPAASAASPTPASASSNSRQNTPVSQSAAPASNLTSIIESNSEVQTNTPGENKAKPTSAFSTTYLPQKISTKDAASNNTPARSGIMAAVFLIVGVCMILLRRFRKAEPATEDLSDYPGINMTSLPPPVPPPLFSPLESVDSNVPTRNQNEPEDMYEIANKYPGSFGNVHYADQPAIDQNSAHTDGPAVPWRMLSRLPTTQLHSQSKPTDPYSDRNNKLVRY